MTMRTQIAQALGKRATIRLRDSDGGFRDVVGVLQSETTLINRRGETISFDPEQAVAFRVIPVFNRRDISTGSLSMYDTMTRTLQTIAGDDGAVKIYCCGPTVYRDAHVGNLRTFLLSDLISRTLQLTGLDVTLVQNITDVRGTAFQQKVWQALRDIKAGDTASYSDVAIAIEELDLGPVDLVGLSYVVDYFDTGGEFTGSGEDVSCFSLLNPESETTFTTFNDEEGTSTLLSALAKTLSAEAARAASAVCAASASAAVRPAC